MDHPGLHQPVVNESQAVQHNALLSQHKSADSKDPDAENTQKPRPSHESGQDLEQDQSEDVMEAYYQLNRWWFTSTASPLLAATFGPLASLMSICALVQSWRVKMTEKGQSEIHARERVPDPPWLLAINAVSLILAIVANLALLLNFARRIRYSVAQPVTIVLWYISSILLIVLITISSSHLRLHPRSDYAFSQSYYYAIIAASLYFIISTLLIANAYGACIANQYPASFSSLTLPQRTLMLQTMSLTGYLGTGAVVFAKIEGWAYVDSLYFCDYTLLTVGLGSDYPLKTTLGKALLIPFAFGGITVIGIVVGSVRGLVLERGKKKVGRRAMQKERIKQVARIESQRRKSETKTETTRDRYVHPAGEREETCEKGHRREFNIMRQVQQNAIRDRKWYSLMMSLCIFLIIWLLGAMVFTFSEKPQKWTYFESLYFTYTTLLTIGYGDDIPKSNSGKPFFVIWSLMAVPSMTILISDIGDTIVVQVKEITLWVGQRTILPDKTDEHLNKHPALHFRGVSVVRMSNGGKGMETERQADTPNTITKIASTIKRITADSASTPGKKYSYEEWMGFLQLLGEQEPSSLSPITSSSPPLPSSSSSSSSSSSEVNERGKKEAKVRRENDSKEEGKGKKKWSWLSEDGPLMSDLTEVEWLLEKLCEKLMEVLAAERGREGQAWPL